MHRNKETPLKSNGKKDNENGGEAKDKEVGVSKKCKTNRVAKKKKEPGKVLLLADYRNSDFIAGHIINVGGLPKVFLLWFTPYLILLANMYTYAELPNAVGGDLQSFSPAQVINILSDDTTQHFFSLQPLSVVPPCIGTGHQQQPQVYI